MAGRLNRQLTFRDGRFRLLNDGTTPDHEPIVTIYSHQIVIGCTTVSREAVEAAAALFEKHYPTEQPPAVKVQ